MMLDDFHFLRPIWLLAVAPLILAMLLLWRHRQRAGSWQAVCDPHLLPFILDTGTDRVRLWPWLAIFLCGLLAILALAGPVWQQLPQPVFRQQSALVVALNLSRSMEAADVQPSRLVRARLKLLDLLAKREDGQTALVAYAGDAFAVTPLTDDTATIAALVPSLSSEIMPLQGSRADLALAQAGKLFAQTKAARGHVVLITDGDEANELDAAVDELRRAGHTLSVIGVGTPEGAPIATQGGFVKDRHGQIVVARLDEPRLRQLAAAGGGQYARLSVDESDVLTALRPVTERIAREVSATELKADRWREEGPWLLLLALPLVAWGFRRGHLSWIAVCLVPWSPAADAWEWQDLWLTPDQRGAQAMAQQDYPLAMQRFEDPGWRASAAYRGKNYEEAVAALSQLDTPAANYNRGNALARLGRIPEALAAYQRTLEQQPRHEDARYNLELLRELSEQPPQPNQGQQGDQSEDQRSDAESGSENADAGDGAENSNGHDPSSAEAADTSEPESARQQDASQQRRSEERESRAQQRERTNQDRPSREPQPAEYEPRNEEEQQATEQWLRRIPDDPGGLLRRKFRYQYSRRYRRPDRPTQDW